jgi:hypothetical protein
MLPTGLLSRNVTIKIYTAIHLPVVLYGFVTSPVILREEHKLRAFRNSVLRRIFVAKRKAATADGRKLHNEEHHNFHPSLNIMLII